MTQPVEIKGKPVELPSDSTRTTLEATGSPPNTQDPIPLAGTFLNALSFNDHYKWLRFTDINSGIYRSEDPGTVLTGYSAIRHRSLDFNSRHFVSRGALSAGAFATIPDGNFADRAMLGDCRPQRE